ncbi:MAG: nuclear transport factor 2 family protein [Sandaracinaceae bacterium]|nr:nuclear transport factor 2 family protein [Sandaracinaceae bacterium]
MATTTIERELLDLERQYWNAVKENDIDAVLRLTDHPCVIAGPSGIGMIEKNKLRAMMKGATYTLDRFELGDNAKVRFLTDDVAIIAYSVHEELTVDGQRVHLDCADASTWVRRDGKWLCALHTESLEGDPFGRDKVQPNPAGSRSRPRSTHTAKH